MVRFLNCFEAPPGREDDFMALWLEVNKYMAAKDGYVAHVMHRSLSPEAHFRFINYVTWESTEAWERAHDDGFRSLVGKPEWAEFTTTPGLFDVVHEGASQTSEPARAHAS